MASCYEFVVNIDSDTYNEFVYHHPLKSIHQCANWANMKPNWQSFNCGLKENGKLVASALVLVRSQYGLKMAYIPRGPLMDYRNKGQVKAMLQNLRLYCANNGISTVIFDPNLIVNTVSIKDKASVDDFDMSGYLSTIMCGKYVHHRGLTKSIEETTLPRYQLSFVFDDLDLLMRLPRKTREKVTHYLDHGLTVRESKDCAKFYSLIEYTEKRKGIALRNEQYFHDLLENFTESTILIATVNLDDVISHLTQLKAEYVEKIGLYSETAPKKTKQWQSQVNRLDKEINESKALLQQYGSVVDVSALLLVSDGDTCELLYSGLNEDFRKYHPAYALRYKALEWAKANGCHSFNFGGVEGTLDDGLFTFKSSFDPSINVYAGEFILSCKWSNIIFEKGLPMLRKIRDKQISKEKKSDTTNKKVDTK